MKRGMAELEKVYEALRITNHINAGSLRPPQASK